MNDIPNELRCPLCLSLIIQPVRTPCSHVFCHECLSRSIIYNPKCPLCRGDLEKFDCEKVDKEFEEEWNNKLKEHEIEDDVKRKREKEVERQKRRNIEIILEYGNTAEMIPALKSYKKKYKWKLFVRIPPKKRKFLPPFSSLVEEVRFDINPGYDKFISVKKPPYEIERSGTLENFEVTITCVWKKMLGFGKKEEITHTLTFENKRNVRNFVKDVPVKKARVLFPRLYRLKMGKKKKKKNLRKNGVGVTKKKKITK